MTYSNIRNISRKIMFISFIWYLLVPYAMTSLVIGKLGKIARLWFKMYLLPNKEIYPFESSCPCLYSLDFNLPIVPFQMASKISAIQRINRLIGTKRKYAVMIRRGVPHVSMRPKAVKQVCFLTMFSHFDVV